MFTDGPTTPRRVEVFLDVVRWFGERGERKFKRSALIELMQPETLPELPPRRDQATATLLAASELGFVATHGDIVETTFDAASRVSSRRLLITAFESTVLAQMDVERHLALFYSFLLGLGVRASQHGSDELVIDFEAKVYGGVRGENPFNTTKLAGLRRWLRYVGLGWHDSDDTFHPSPYGRVKRSLVPLFGRKRKLDSEGFRNGLAELCPELDGGWIFRKANLALNVTERVLTLGLSQALIALHDDRIIRLHSYPDSQGWSLIAAEPTPDNQTFKADRIESVEFLKHSEEEADRD
jgi:hypothetical protein